MNYQDYVRSQSEFSDSTIRTDTRQVFAVDLVESIHQLINEIRELRKLLEQKEHKTGATL